MKVIQRLCYEDYTVTDEAGASFTVERGKEYTTTIEPRDGEVMVFSRYWVWAPLRIFDSAQTQNAGATPSKSATSVGAQESSSSSSSPTGSIQARLLEHANQEAGKDPSYLWIVKASDLLREAAAKVDAIEALVVSLRAKLDAVLAQWNALEGEDAALDPP